MKHLKLIHYIESQMGLPFKLGKNDCILFVAGAIDAMYSTKLRAKYAGLWKTQQEVLEYTTKNKSVSEILHKLNYEVVDTNHMQVGDVIIIEQEDIKLQTYAVFTGSKIAIFTKKGLLLIEISQVIGIKEVLRCQQYY